MPFKSINPADDATLTVIQAFDADQLEAALAETAAVTPVWAATPIQERCRLMHAAATVLRSRSEELATLISQEMGKLIGEARAEVEKCALVCEYYEEFGPGFLRDESIDSDATNSFVAYQPIGTVLAVMPWNFPF